MRAHFNLPSVLAEDSEGKPPIHVKFEIPYFTVSGIQVTIYAIYLKWQIYTLYVNLVWKIFLKRNLLFITCVPV